MLTERQLLGPEELKLATDTLKMLSHPVRLRIVDILMHASLPVHAIAALCHLPPHQTCEHLRMMQKLGALGSQRRGREVHYSLTASLLPSLMQCVRRGLRPKNAAEDRDGPPGCLQIFGPSGAAIALSLAANSMTRSE